MRKYGIDAFHFEVLIICFNEACNQIEREYIAKYNCIVPNGYNILEGGQCGGGFKGKRHSEETLKKIGIKSKELWNNPEYAKRMSENAKRQMAAIDKETHRNRTLNSEKFKKAMKEGRVGASASTMREKISNTLQKYYHTDIDPATKEPVNIKKHRSAMAKATGRKVDQFTRDNIYVATHISISEAGRTVGISKYSIGAVLGGRNKTGGGFIWKYHDEGVQTERPANVIVTPDA
jgi:group I intron endonuclease